MIGLVLEGGGAKGAYHIGAYKAINEIGINIDGIAGTSVGALNGAMIAQGDFDKAYDLWYNMSYSRVMNVDDKKIRRFKNFELGKEDVLNLMKKVGRVISNGGVDITPLRGLLNEVVDEEKIRASGLDFGIVTVSISDMKPLQLFIEDIPHGKLSEYLMASAYFPAFKREKMDGKLFIDGGLYDNLPIDLLASRGYKEIIAIRTHGIGRTRKIDEENLDITYISPNEDLGKTLDFSMENARKNLKLGYFDGIRVLKGLKGSKYYIESKKDEEYFISLLLKLGEDKIVKIGQVMGIKDISYRRALFEFIIPRINDLLGIDKSCDYEDVVIRIYEAAASKCEVERFKIYRYDDFTQLVLKHYSKNKNSVSNKIPDFIKQNDLLAKIARDQIIDEIISIIFNNEK